jgi:urease accessory protein
VEPAVTAGTVVDLDSLEAFLRGRLRTSGLVAAGIAAAVCARCAGESRAAERNAALAVDDPGRNGAIAGERRAGDGKPGPGKWDQRLVPYDGFDFWGEIDAEADARTPSPAQRAASRRQGRALLRAARVAWPEDRGLAGLADFVAAGSGAGGARGSVTPAAAAARATGSGANAEYRGGPHQAVVLGAAAAAAGCEAAEAARIATYQSVAGPASAAVRLLALDPMRASAVLARLSGDVDQIAGRAAAAAEGPLGELPYPSAPALDLLAEAHIRAEVRLFES